MSGNKTRKGIILAGGKGSRLYPLTYGTTKALLPVYDKPLIHYPIATLKSFGIHEILIIGSSVQHCEGFKHATKDIKDVEFDFAVQKEAKGICDAFIIGEEFCDNKPVTLMLGDNIFDGMFPPLRSVNTVYGVTVDDPKAYGVVDFDATGTHIVGIVEKPDVPPSKYAVPGLYHFDNRVCEFAKLVKPSARGELEITDLITIYIRETFLDKSGHSMKVDILPNDMVWFDCGTFDHLLEAGNYVQAIQHRTGRVVGNVGNIN